MPSVQEHAAQVMQTLKDRGDISQDADSAVLAAGIPSFSKGTAPLDDNTGDPVVPREQAALPGFTEGQVPVPTEGADAKPVEPPPSAKQILEAHLAATSAAGANGRATQPPEGEPAPPEPPAAQQAGAAAAEAAAEDLWADAEEFEFDDPDLDVKIPMRVPKKFATPARRGYQRRSTFDREWQWLKNAEQTLGPLVRDGRINNILPLIQAALDDPDGYGAYVAQGYERRRQGLPLIEQARQEAVAAGAAQVAPPPLDPALDPDPFFAEQLRPVMSRVDEINQRLEREERARQADAERQRQQQTEAQRVAQDMEWAHHDIAQRYPHQTNIALQSKDPFYEKSVRYAIDAGYVRTYGWRAGILLGSDQVANIEAERLAATASPAAAALNGLDAQQQEIARRQAASASRTVGTGAPAQAPAAPPPQRPSNYRPDGSLKKPDEFLRDNQRWLVATGQLQA
jgi:hypothetical protein